MEQVKASVIIPTYNHAQYISRAIESAIGQECSFPFEIIIGDDCSSDGTGEICRKYAAHPHVTLISHSRNRGLIGNYRSLFSEAKGTYIAILEGDDFWKWNKLAEQVDYLESHPDAGFVHSNGYFLFENGRRTLIHKEPVPSSYGFKEVFQKNLIVSVTACFRKELLVHVDLERFESLGFRTIDYPLWLEFSQHTRLGYIHKPLATYRILAGSVSNSRSFERRRAFESSNRSIMEYYLEKYPTEGLDQQMILSKYNEKMFNIILACGSFSDQAILSEEHLHLSGLKRLALGNRLLFLLFQGIIRLFFRRI